MTETTWLAAGWMQTYTGRKFYPTQPNTDDIDPVDIAHALSMICRYGGHVDRFYSVAEHCVLMSYYVPAEDALWALLHDATEAYVGDMVRPLKRQLPAYEAIEDNLMVAILERFGMYDGTGLVPPMPRAVKDADNRILLTERAALMSATPPGEWAVDGLVPLNVHISGWSPKVAEVAYAARLEELTR